MRWATALVAPEAAAYIETMAATDGRDEGARELIGFNDAARLLGIHGGAVVLLQQADLIPWHPTAGLPGFDPAELEAIGREQLVELLAKAGIYRARSREDFDRGFPGGEASRSRSEPA